MHTYIKMQSESYPWASVDNLVYVCMVYTYTCAYMHTYIQMQSESYPWASVDNLVRFNYDECKETKSTHTYMLYIQSEGKRCMYVHINTYIHIHIITYIQMQSESYPWASVDNLVRFNYDECKEIRTWEEIAKDPVSRTTFESGSLK
jgi:hypothetical protein